ncbi:MAG: GNAT family N-acetyltransferase [Proteobacteria bacterium]|nr:GNAT family N-acetyltransferase [Pseudomonadota bacterium]
MTEDITVTIETEADPERLASLWRDLEGRAESSFQLSWDWIGCWLALTGLRPPLVVARRGGRVVGLALLQPSRERRHGWLTSNTLVLNQTGDDEMDVITIEYNGFLAERGLETEVADCCLAALARTRSLAASGAAWDELRFPGVSAAYIDHARRHGLRVHIHAQKPSPAIALDAIRLSGRGYLDHLSANTRYQIRRALRLYEARGKVSFATARDAAEGLQFFEELGVFHQRYWTARGQRGAWGYPFFLKFHRTMIERCLPTGAVEIVRVAVATQAIGYLYNFVYRGAVYAYLSGFHYEDDPKLKPGLVSHYLCTERHLASGARLYDFMAGADRYKTNLGQNRADMYWLTLQRPRLKLRLESGLRAAKHIAHGMLAGLRAKPTDSAPPPR